MWHGLFVDQSLGSWLPAWIVANQLCVVWCISRIYRILRVLCWNPFRNYLNNGFKFEKSFFFSKCLYVSQHFITFLYFILLYIIKSVEIKNCRNIDQGMFETHFRQIHYGEFIVCGKCYFEFLKVIWAKSREKFRDFWVQLCVHSVTFSSKEVLKVTK